ncbi:hypothetical protein SynNOUM97013_00261 [Synechococcus sp. NOUM97013]|nr:hypothetical protein SynNOUM97013_00261 [Synechococcus sp. NOUM97013]
MVLGQLPGPNSPRSLTNTIESDQTLALSLQGRVEPLRH